MRYAFLPAVLALLSPACGSEPVDSANAHLVSGPLPSRGSGAAVAATAAVNNDRNFLQVYVNNVENLVDRASGPCAGQPEDLLAYMNLQDYVPDLFLVQQISDWEQAEKYEAQLEAKFGQPYEHVIAYPQGEQRREQGSDCSKKYLQTNAVFYRSNRLTPNYEPPTIWESYTPACRENEQDRSRNVGMQFTDSPPNAPSRTVFAATIHWPTDGNSICNIDETAAKMDTKPSSDLFIFGGDMNDDDLGLYPSTEWTAWYKKTNGALPEPGVYGYADAIYGYCLNRSLLSPSPTLHECIRSNATLVASINNGKFRRIDFLFAKRPGPVPAKLTHQHTVTIAEANEAGGNSTVDYSEHLAVHARVYYPANTPPAFTSDPIIKPEGTAKQPYSGTLAGDAMDADADNLAFALTGPGWLSVAENGALSGTPPCSALGPNPFTARVSDGNAIDAAALNITVTDVVPGLPPVVVDAGPNQSIISSTFPALANLSGTYTTPGFACPRSVLLKWTKVSGPGTVTFGDDSSAATTASFSAEGPDPYVLRLTVTELPTGSSDSDDVEITVARGTGTPIEIVNDVGALSVAVNRTQKGSQSFRYGNAGGDPYWIRNVRVYLSRPVAGPDGDLVFSIGTAINNGALPNSTFRITPGSVASSNNTENGNTFAAYDIPFSAGNGVGPFTAGTTYYLNFDGSAIVNAKAYFVAVSGATDPYPGGNYFRGNTALTQRDAKFRITGRR